MEAWIQKAREALNREGPRQAFERWLAANDARIRRPELDNGRELAAERTAIYLAAVAAWAERERTAFGYDRPFAVVAIGGTGRGEMAPCSDNDFALLFDDELEGNPFLAHLQQQILQSDQFEREFGFVCYALPFNLEAVPDLAGKQLNAFLDMRPVYDPHGLADLFRERIRATCDTFEHFLHVRGFWKDHWEKAADECERLDRFDIKNDGLRLFLAGIWTLAGQRFQHSAEIYATLDDPRDLAAYEFLMRVRAFVHLRQRGKHRPLGGGNHPEDVLRFEDFLAFGELLGPEAGERERFEFANEVRARLLAARRRVARFAKSVIQRVLKEGRPVAPGSPIVFGLGGLAHTTAHRCRTPREKSRAALSLLLAAQRYNVPIDPTELETTFRNAGDWLEPVPELAALFYERRGSLARTFAFLSQIEGAEERLFPGYARFEASLDGRVMSERRLLRSALEREKLAALERFVEEGRQLAARRISASADGPLALGDLLRLEAAQLDAEHLAAIRLALKTKRLPVLPEDEAARADESRPLHERFASGLSGIPLARYYERYRTLCDFTPETLRIVEFLQLHRREFKERSESGLNTDDKVDELVALSGDENLLRALLVFTGADRAAWESAEQDPARWFNTRELYDKAMKRFRPGLDARAALGAAGFSPPEQAIIADFGDAFFGGFYRQYLGRFGSHLLRLATEPENTPPKVVVLRDGASVIVGVAARDYPGLAATLTGALWSCRVVLQQAHLFSATHHGLALDFFHVAPDTRALPPDLARTIEQAILERRHIAPGDEAGLPPLAGEKTLTQWRTGLHRLRFETASEAGGLLYALTYKVFRHLRGNIYGLEARSVRGRSFVTVYFNLPPDLPLEAAAAIVRERF